MLKYRELNVNPKHRKTGDCSTRALSTVLKIPYDEAIDLQAAESKKHFYGLTNKETLGAILEAKGWVKMKQPRKDNGKKYFVNELDQITTKKQRDDGVFLIVANHCVAVEGDSIIDIWNSGYKCIGNYWVKR